MIKIMLQLLQPSLMPPPHVQVSSMQATIKHLFSRGLRCGVFCASLLLTINSAHAEEPPNLAKATVVVPEKIAGVTTVSAEDVLKTLTSDNAILLIDARIELDRAYGYIENSISLPDIKTNCDTLNEITSGKNQRIMFYCNGVQCGRSVISIKVARSCGYHNLFWFKGGFAEWEEKGYPYLKDL